MSVPLLAGHFAEAQRRDAQDLGSPQPVLDGGLMPPGQSPMPPPGEEYRRAPDAKTPVLVLRFDRHKLQQRRIAYCNILIAGHRNEQHRRCCCTVAAAAATTITTNSRPTRHDPCCGQLSIHATHQWPAKPSVVTSASNVLKATNTLATGAVYAATVAATHDAMGSRNESTATKRIGLAITTNPIAATSA